MMLILRGENGKTIHLTLNNTIHEINNDVCIIEMPVIVCNNKKDAERIQEDINLFVHDIIRNVLKNKKG